MHCEQCGRSIKNAEMWQLGGDRNAPTSRTMRQLCWDCRDKAERTSLRETSSTPRERIPSEPSRSDDLASALNF